MSSTPHVAIIGSALSGNKGASAMLESSIQTLRDRLPGARFTLFSMYPNEDAAQAAAYPELDIVPASPIELGVAINSLALAYRLLPPLRPLLLERSKAVRTLADAQVLLDQGGITFTDGREKFLLYNVASILPALNMGTPVFKCAQAVGPFENPVNRWAARTFLPKVATLVTRGRITHEFAQGLGLTNLFAGADYAFSLDLAGDEEALATKHVDLSIFDDEVTGISPSVVLQKKVDGAGGDYVGHILHLIDELGARGRRVLLIPHSARTGTDKTHNNDLPLCAEIASRAKHPELLTFVGRELPSQVLRYLIGRCDTFVASRFHAMVSSLAMGVPTLVIGWSHKYEEVLEMFGLERWAFGHAHLTGEYLTERHDELLEHRDEQRALLAEHLPQVRARSVAQADLIADLVRAGGARSLARR